MINKKFFMTTIFLLLVSFTAFAADLSLKYRCTDTNPSANQIRGEVEITNTSGGAINLTTLSFRYYRTKEGSAAEQVNIDYAAVMGSTYRMLNSGNFTFQITEEYIGLGFFSSAGTLAANDKVTVQLRVNKSDWSNYDQSDDYSFDPAMTGLMVYNKIPAYLGGVLKVGEEPGSFEPWALEYGGPDYNYNKFFDIEETGDGGFIAAGSTGSLWVVKTDKEGQVEWQKSYAQDSSSEGRSIKPTADGGYIVAGRKKNNQVSNDEDAWILKLSAAGAVQWEKSFDVGPDDGLNDIIQTGDGNFLATGYCDDMNRLWIMKLDLYGAVIWQKVLEEAHTSGGKSVIQTADGNFVVTGMADGRFCILKINTNGTILWQKRFGDCYFATLNCYETSDGNIIAGANENHESWILKLTSSGSVLWQKKYKKRTGLNMFCNSVFETSDGNYLMAGQIWNPRGPVGFHDYYRYDGFLMKVDKTTGAPIWSKAYGNLYFDAFNSAIETSDGQIAAAGYYDPVDPSIRNRVSLIAKIGADGSCPPIEMDETVEAETEYFIFENITAQASNSYAVAANTNCTVVNTNIIPSAAQ